MNDNEYWLKIWAIVFSSVAIIASIAIIQHHITVKRYVENGYTQKMLTGNSYPVWVKGDSNV